MSSAAGTTIADLVAHTLDGLAIEPLYTAYDRPAADLFVDQRRPTPSEGLAWDIRVATSSADPAAANAALLADLAGGASSVTLNLAAPGLSGLPTRYEAVARVLAGVDLAVAPVHLCAGDQYLGAAQCLSALWDAAGIAGARCRGGIDADPLGTLARTGALEETVPAALAVLAHFAGQNIAAWPNVTLVLADGRPYHEAGASQAQELAAILATFVTYLRGLDEEGVAPETAIPSFHVALAADCDFLMSIAKLRAARRLIARVCGACGGARVAAHVALSVTTSARMLTRRDLHTNMLRTTIAAAAAVLGGADALTVRPHTEAVGVPDAFAARIARNTHHVLMAEAKLGRVADPAAGSYALERLTDEMARAAWSLFQEIEARGGMAAALTTGFLAEGIAAMAAKRARQLGDGTLSLVGVTAYPGEDEEQFIVAGPPLIPAPVERAGTRMAPLQPRRTEVDAT